MTPVRLAVVGAGARGSGYARLAIAAGSTITAVVEPDPRRRAAFLADVAGQPVTVFDSWEQLAAARPLVADAAIVATPDRAHVEPAVGLAGAGYHLLLEKPMAPTRAESRRIVDAAEAAGVMVAVCHVMRYTPYTDALKGIVERGDIGDIVSVQHLEPIGWWHFAHSYVRGNWAREASSSSMLLAKSSHDIDWLSYVIGRRVTAVSSFGGLMHFTRARKPEGAAARCLDCPLQRTCSYSATTIYRRFVGDPVLEVWPLRVLTSDVTQAGLEKALREGPYGECVFNGQNDVADHQVVNLEYEGGATASFTVTAFTELDFRKTRIFGTDGWIEGDGESLRIHAFATDTSTVVTSSAQGGASAADGHGGADGVLVEAFLEAVATGDASRLRSGPRESLESHEIVWAAERARHGGTVERLDGGG